MTDSDRAQAMLMIEKEVAENGGLQYVAPEDFVAAVRRVVPGAKESHVMSLVEVYASGGAIDTAVLAEGRDVTAKPVEAAPAAVVESPVAPAPEAVQASPSSSDSDEGDEEMEQASLLPERRVDPEAALVPLSALPANSELPGDAPDDEFVMLIDKLGLLQAVGLIDHGDRYEVAFGRRRIKAARALAWDQISALIWPADWTAAEVLALVENAQRKPNPASDYRSIVDLVGRGYSEKQIARAMGMTVATVRARMRLDGLPAPLKKAFLANALSTSMAEKIVRQSPSVRERIAAVYEKKGEVKAADVDAARRVQTKAAAASLGGMLASVPSSVKPDVRPDATVLAAETHGNVVRFQIRVNDHVYVGEVPALALSTVLVQAGLVKEVTGEGSDRVDAAERSHQDRRSDVHGRGAGQRRQRATVDSTTTA